MRNGLKLAHGDTRCHCRRGANGLSNDAYSPALETDKPLSGCPILLPRQFGCLSACRQTQINSVPERISFLLSRAYARAIIGSGSTPQASVAERLVVLPPVSRERSHASQNQSV